MGNNPARILRIHEKRAIDLVKSILGAEEVIRDRGVFDWLRGDTGMRLRVDAYFPREKLVVEYHGEQKFKPNPFMDRRPGRRKQREEYMERRKSEIEKHGLELLELRYDEPLEREYIRKKLILLGYEI